MLFLTTDNNLNFNKIIILIPIIPFMFLDAFYLGLERHFIDEYNKEFASSEIEINKIKNEILKIQFNSDKNTLED